MIHDHLVTGEVTKIRENGATSGVGVLATYADACPERCRRNDLGRRTSLTFGNGTSQAYAYDPVSRLSSLTANLAGTTSDLTIGSIAYNPASQIMSQVRSNDAYAWTGHGSGSTSYGIDGLNRLTSVGGTATTFDGNKNLTLDPVTGKTLAYSSENLLTSSTGGTSASFIYDPLMRLEQVIAGGATTRFGFDGLDPIVEWDGAGAVLRRYVHGPGMDEPIVWYEGSGLTDRRFLHSDERGSIVAASDSSGALIGINRYDEFGKPQGPSGAGTLLGRFGYTGQMWLPEIGVHYYKARMYAPHLGRFYQPDPIGYAGGMNLYAYVRNDPVNFVDPLGLSPNTSPSRRCEWYQEWDGSQCVGVDEVWGPNQAAGAHLGWLLLGGPTIERWFNFDLRDITVIGQKWGRNVTTEIRSAFCAIPPAEIMTGADAYLGLGASGSIGFSFDITTFQFRGVTSSTIGAGYGGGLGIGLAPGSREPGFTQHLTGTVAAGPVSVTASRGGISSGKGFKFGSQGGAWGGLTTTVTSAASPMLINPCNR